MHLSITPRALPEGNAQAPELRISRVNATRQLGSSMRTHALVAGHRGLGDALLAAPLVTVGAMEASWRVRTYACTVAGAQVLATADGVVYLLAHDSVIARRGESTLHTLPLAGRLAAHLVTSRHGHGPPGHRLLLYVQNDATLRCIAFPEGTLVYEIALDDANVVVHPVQPNLLVCVQRPPQHVRTRLSQVALVSVLDSVSVFCTLVAPAAAVSVLHADLGAREHYSLVLHYRDLGLVIAREPHLDLQVHLPSVELIVCVRGHILVYMPNAERGDVHVRNLHDAAAETRVYDSVAMGALWMAVDGGTVRVRTRSGLTELMLAAL